MKESLSKRLRPTSTGQQDSESEVSGSIGVLLRLIGGPLCQLGAVAFFVLTLADGAQVYAQSTRGVEDWVARQIWVANIESSLPAGVNLAVSAISDPEEEDSGWQSFQLRSVHEEGSGFDPNVSPSMGIFRVNVDRTTVEWLDPLSGEWDSLTVFLRSRKMGPGTKSDAAPGTPTKNELSADIDDDGKAETVQWKLFDEIDGDRFFYLKVIDDDGTKLWTGPRKSTFENAYVFFESHFGISLPQLLYDIDGDGAPELLGPEPQSDVSPTYFRCLTWREGAFFPRSTSALMMDDPESKKLAWKEGNYSRGIWVSGFGPVSPEGLVQVQITDYRKSEKWRGGAALIRFRRGGATIEKWIEPLSSEK